MAKKLKLVAKGEAAPKMPPVTPPVIAAPVVTAPVVTAPTVAAKVVKVPEARHAPTTAVLTWKVQANCKRPGSASHARAAGYWGKPTVAEYLAAGATRADLSWDADHGFFDLKA